MIDPRTDIHPVCHPQFRSTIVRESLRHHKVACAGFALGRLMPDYQSPHFDFPLVAVTFKDCLATDYDEKFAELGRFRMAAEETATKFGRAVIGLWAAWDSPWFVSGLEHTRKGTLVDLAKTMNIPFVITLSTDGGEPMWPVLFWMVQRFPHQAIHSAKSKEKSIDPNDNFRRVKSEWRRQLASNGLPIP